MIQKEKKIENTECKIEKEKKIENTECKIEKEKKIENTECKIEKEKKIENTECKIEKEKKINFLKEIDDPEISKLKKKILDSEDDLIKNKTYLETQLNKTKYLFKKEIEKNHKFYLEKFISELLPILDNIERALESIVNSKEESVILISKKLKKLINLILNMFSFFNVKVIKEKNILFDPKIHQAISVQKSSDIESNYVILVMQKGYILNNRLLRPAMVIVSK
ncbi:nucleotide exchange factor GrpE [Buchnera aphidicola]|uniref:nucleotide exchange factor GrpE n=1 Tax=Buchnera aphidicola TaxID=9 RepID=UPI0031B6D845